MSRSASIFIFVTNSFLSPAGQLRGLSAAVSVSAAQFSPESEKPESWLRTLCPVGEFLLGVSVSLEPRQLRLRLSLKEPAREPSGLAGSTTAAASFPAVKLTERSSRPRFFSPLPIRSL